MSPTETSSGLRTAIRQVVLGVPDVAAASAQAQHHLGLAPGFADPLLAEIGMADESLVLGGGRSFLEFVGPLRSDTSLQRWLDRGGPGGYALAIQVSALDPLLARAARLGIGLAADTTAYGHRIVQLRPKDVGLLVEFDEIADPDVWFWDDVPKQVPTAPRVDDVAWIELSSPDPIGQAAQWATLFATEVVERDGRPGVMVGGTPVHFVAGPRPMMSAVGLTPSLVHPPAAESIVLGGVRFDLRPVAGPIH